jgi:hypothetical protein
MELRGHATAKPKSEQAQARERAMPAGFGSARAVPVRSGDIGSGENPRRRRLRWALGTAAWSERSGRKTGQSTA